MGQYYTATNIEKFEYLESWDYDNGAKLMEHSYIGNDYVNQVIELLKDEWYKTKIVWNGDYSEKIFDDYDLSRISDGVMKKIQPQKKSDNNKVFLINFDRKEYINLGNYKEGDLNPLPLLTSFGNGNGGGDYNGNLMEHIGTWSCDTLGVQTELNVDDDFQELKELFFEEGDNSLYYEDSYNDNVLTSIKIKNFLNEHKKKEMLLFKIEGN